MPARRFAPATSRSCSARARVIASSRHALERARISAYVYKGLGFFDADEIKDVLALLWYLADPVVESSRGGVAALAASSGSRTRASGGSARTWPTRSRSAARAPRPRRSTPTIAEALRLARASSARWRALADRMPPAELLDRILEESAYARRARGPRFAQARENLKKIRAIIRRIQNRGYATLERIVSHLDRLAVGDEANAAIDALDAVSLMTVHAAKGLEFPVVFVVNLSRGTGNGATRFGSPADGPATMLGGRRRLSSRERDEDEAASESARRPSVCSTSR